MKWKAGIRKMIAIVIGTAAFVVLSKIAIPLGTIADTALQPREAVVAVVAALHGPIAGAVMGMLGHTIADVIFYGEIWWSWVLPEGIIGVIIGMFSERYAVRKGNFDKKEMALFNRVQICANLVGWLVAAPVLDMVLYGETVEMALWPGVGAAVANLILVSVLGTGLLSLYSNIVARARGVRDYQ